MTKKRNARAFDNSRAFRIVRCLGVAFGRKQECRWPRKHERSRPHTAPLYPDCWTQTAMAKSLKYAVISLIFLSCLIVPYLLFGASIEAFAVSFFRNTANDGIAMLMAGALLASDPVLPIPSSVVATLLATKVGFWPAGLVNAVSLSLACVFAYALGRGGGAALDRMGRALPPSFAEWTRRHGLVAVLLCRPVPVLSEASLILAGAAGHEPRRLLGWCSLSQVALGFAYAFAGSGWGQGGWNTAAILAGSVGIPLVSALAVLVMVRPTLRPRAAPR